MRPGNDRGEMCAIDTACPPVRTRQPRPAAGPSVRSLDGIDRVPARDWDGLLLPGQAGLSQGYLSAWRRLEMGLVRERHLLAGADGLPPVAAAPGYLYDVDLLSRCLPRSLERIARGLRALLSPRLGRIGVYDLGSPVALVDPIMRDRGIEPDAATRLLVAAAIEQAQREGVPVVVVQDYPWSEARRSGVFAQLGFAAVPILPTVVLELPFGSFEDYLAAMRSPYRRRARVVLARSARLMVERRHEFADEATELARLSASVYERAREVKRERPTPEYFRAASALEQTSALMVRRDDGSIASFAVLLDDRPWLHFLNCGFEVHAAQQHAAYFRLLYEIVRAGILDGATHVNLGITTIAPKLDVGGVPVPLLAWVRYHRPAVQRVFAAFARRLLGPPTLSPRRVFVQGR